MDTEKTNLKAAENRLEMANQDNLVGAMLRAKEEVENQTSKIKELEDKIKKINGILEPLIKEWEASKIQLEEVQNSIVEANEELTEEEGKLDRRKEEYAGAKKAVETASQKVKEMEKKWEKRSKSTKKLKVSSVSIMMLSREVIQ